MRINFGCGRIVEDGWFNIDAAVSPRAKREPELLFTMEFDNCKLRSQIPLPDGCATELQAMHVIEHFYRYDVEAVLEEWKRLLEDGGRLILELPNIELAAKNLLAGMNDQMCMWPLFGDPSHCDPYMTHHWAYSPKTISHLLKQAGFTNIEIKRPQTHGPRPDRDMRVEAIKL